MVHPRLGEWVLRGCPHDLDSVCNASRSTGWRAALRTRPSARRPLPGIRGWPGPTEHTAGGCLRLEGVLHDCGQGPGRGHGGRRVRVRRRPARSRTVLRLVDGESGLPRARSRGDCRRCRASVCGRSWRHAGECESGASGSFDAAAVRVEAVPGRSRWCGCRRRCRRSSRPSRSTG